jgi:predicted dehydrogenase
MGDVLSKIRLAIVGCGVMGNRHLAGLVELSRAGLSEFELVAVCDPVRESAQILARRAEEQLGGNMVIAENLEELASAGVQAIDSTTVPWVHHTIAVEALQRSWHVMVEKPMGLTVRACKLMLEAADNSQGVLSVAENFHYDPMNRIGRELLRAEAIGKPRFMIHNSVGGGDRIIVTPWRHYKRGGGPLLDVGVHNAYVTEYLLCEVESVYAQTRLYEKIRRGKDNEEIEADAEDAVYATLLFSSGATGQYIEDHAAHGQGLWQRIIYGSAGSMHLPGDRSGKPITLTLDGKGTIADERILDFIPDFRLDSITASLFGGERIWRYDLPFPEIDRKLLAIEYADFAESILKGRPPEVDLMAAARSVALPYAMLESSRIGRAVTVKEVMNEEVSAYQDEINRSIGLIK